MASRLKHLRFMAWLVVLPVRYHMGRWYIFRDAPDMVVRAIKRLSSVDDGRRPIVSGVIAEARNEWSMRMINRKRCKHK